MSPNHVQLDKTQRMHKACVDVKNKEVWNGLYVLCGLCHGPLLVIRYSDAAEPAMDKVFYWSYMTCVYIKQNKDKINAVSFFPREVQSRRMVTSKRSCECFFRIQREGMVCMMAYFLILRYSL